MMGDLYRPPSDLCPISSTHVKWLTLSSVSSILQIKRPQSIPRRREDVPHQLALWPEAERPTQPQDIWEDLDSERKTIVIAILAKLIRKAARPKTQEDKHER
jgi:hypothetical protein